MEYRLTLRRRLIEARVILLLLFEFLHGNPTFRKMFASTLRAQEVSARKMATGVAPLPLALISLSSYILSHASSTSSPRAIAYANLVLNTLLVLVEDDDTITALLKNDKKNIRLCRQVCAVFRWGSCSIRIDFLCLETTAATDVSAASSTALCTIGLLYTVVAAQSTQDTRDPMLSVSTCHSNLPVAELSTSSSC